MTQRSQQIEHFLMIEGLLISWGIKGAWSTFGPVLENLAKGVAEDAAKIYVGRCFGSVFSPLNKKPLTKATGLAVKELLKLLEDELLDADLETRELEAMRDAVAAFLEQEPVQQVMGSLFLKPDYYLDPALFAKAWQDSPDAPALPEDFSWKRISKRFSRKVEAIREDSAELRETFARLRSAKDSEALRELSGLPPEFEIWTSTPKPCWNALPVSVWTAWIPTGRPIMRCASGMSLCPSPSGNVRITGPSFWSCPRKSSKA